MSNNDQFSDFSILDDFCTDMKTGQIKYWKKVPQNLPPPLQYSWCCEHRTENYDFEADGMEVDNDDDAAPSNVILIDSNLLATTVFGRYHDAMGIKDKSKKITIIWSMHNVW